VLEVSFKQLEILRTIAVWESNMSIKITEEILYNVFKIIRLFGRKFGLLISFNSLKVSDFALILHFSFCLLTANNLPYHDCICTVHVVRSLNC